MNKKHKGFSLAELLQTVVLLGIIAGLSISFFKRVNVDEKLYNATEKQLAEAILEAERQMCNDSTLYCDPTEGFWSEHMGLTDNNAQCAYFYPNSEYDAETGYCVADPDADGKCPAPQNGATLQMSKYTDGKCYVVPVCKIVATKDADDNPLTYVYQYAKPYHDIVCPGGKPTFVDGANMRTRPGDAAVTEFCYRLHSLINHKRQGGTEREDLIKTCQNDVNDCIFNGSCAQNSSTNTNTNMILPNGVRLYNLSFKNLYRQDDNGNTIENRIIIKCDRIPTIANISAENKTDDDDLDFNEINAVGITITQLKDVATSTGTGTGEGIDEPQT